MDQHTIPLFYLRGFLDPVTPPRQEPYLWFHTHPECKWRKRSPQNLSTKPNYYAVVNSDGRFKHTAEEFLQNIENDAAIAIREVVNRERPVDPSNRRILARFVASMLLRIPRLHNEIESGMISAFLADARNGWQKLRGDPGRLASFRSEMKAIFGDDVDIEGVMSTPDATPQDVTQRRSFVVQETLGSTLLTADRIGAMNWHLVVAEKPDFFIASDWPVSLWTPERPESNFQAGLGLPSVQLTFSLTQRIALLAVWDGRQGDYFNAPPDLVTNINQRTARLAQTVYSPTAGFPGFDAMALRLPDTLGS